MRIGNPAVENVVMICELRTNIIYLPARVIQVQILALSTSLLFMHLMIVEKSNMSRIV